MKIKITFQKTSEKKRRWYVYGTTFTALRIEEVYAIEKLIFDRFNRCTIIKKRPYSNWYELTIQFINDSEEAEFVMWASNGIEVEI